MTTDRDRLAADLHRADDEWMEDCNEPGPHWTVFIADRLITLGWTRHPLGTEEAIAQGQRMLAASEAAADREITRLRDLLATLEEERLARALHRHMGHADRHPDFRGCSWCSPEAAAIAKAYREDTDATD